ncbi:CBN-RIC-8 protein [Caenorhabditis brenneri]|uniref:CBN-RIC-8 protein n=1 Tax=Caenorhabditis brenneri TaxID=135651 RepID=G0MZW7_CAEBE|nr:CBN-RIC-8 protein [Caenorhabditis brenneri]
MLGEPLTAEKIEKIFSGAPEKIEDFFSKWNFSNTATMKFDMELSHKNLLGEKLASFIGTDSLTAVLLETIRLLSRDRNGLEGLLNVDLCNKVLAFAGLQTGEGVPKNPHALMEAQKCLINTMYHSQRMRDVFYATEENSENLLFYLLEFSPQNRKTSEHQWIREMHEVQAAEVWFFYHRIGFISTAMSRDFQKKWANEPKMIDNLLPAVEYIIEKKDFISQDRERANEALKTFFNIFCHFHGEVQAIDQKHAIKATRILRDIICSDRSDDELIMSAVHAVSVPPLPIVLSVWCQDPEKDAKATAEDDEVVDLFREYDDMKMTEALLSSLDKQLTVAVKMLNNTPHDKVSTEANTLCDLIGPYFQALARLCVESKHARRYCRIRVIPPLVADEVKKRPEEHDSLRGRIVRIMMLPSATKDVAAEFLFIICKRSVNRMIKYFGFGHSAGHLANMGLLGQINQQKHASDSEDSETEEYNQVRDNVNPVTGAIYPEDHGSALAGMSDEQKEYEAMKLVDAMNKMMDAGIVKPGTIGEDGRLREVSHVLELIKDAPEPDKDDSDSD